MTVQNFGSLADTSVQADLARANASPELWTVYLIRAKGTKRTPAQNRMFRMLLAKLAQQQGRTVQEWYEFLVERFLGYIDVDTEDGDVRWVLQSTSDLTVEEFTSFLNACLVFAGDIGVH